ncbi:hypothetical protein SEA_LITNINMCQUEEN_77 [Gordonia phage LitninMcQueen]
MSGDPAIAAAQRAWDARYEGRMVSAVDSAAHNGVGALTIAAAREALAPLRELHKPIAMCGVIVCIHCRTATGASASWPCSSAALLYSSSELEGDSDA